MIDFVHSYRSFAYKHVDETFVVFAPNQSTGELAPLLTFPERELMENFVDRCCAQFDQLMAIELDLHFTGCKRCERTAKRVKVDPCRTGLPMFIRLHKGMAEVLKANVDAILADRADSREEEAEAERAAVQ